MQLRLGAAAVAVWHRLGLHERPESSVVLYNNRADRLRRARDMAPLFGDGIESARIVVSGESTAQFLDLLRNRVPREKLVDAGGLDAGQLLDKLTEVSPVGATVVGVGNIGGVGMRFLDLLEKEGRS